MLRFIVGIIIGATVSLLIGGSICMFVNKNTSEECYMAFAAGISLLIFLVAMSIFFIIMRCLDSSLKPILPLSSSPSAPSRILVSRK